MSEPQFVVRRGMAGHLSFAVEYHGVRVTKYDTPIERYTLTPEQALLPIASLIDMAADNTLAKWVAPPPKTKDITTQNAGFVAEVKTNG